MKTDDQQQYLRDWLVEHTQGSTTVVDMGAGPFTWLQAVDPQVARRIGIDIWEPYIQEAEADTCAKILGDFRDFDRLLEEEDMDCALFIDTLEHLGKDDARDLIGRMQAKFRKILLMIPEGNHPQAPQAPQAPQEGDENPYQTHLSTWRVADVQAMDFQRIDFIPDFHTQIGKDPGCIFAVWTKP